jgi:pyruvate formate lyase activating enzyme
VESDGVFFNRSGGGLTISGGEALAQPEFALALLKEAKKRRLNTALETSGVCGFEILAQAASLLDGILYDLKHWSQAKHLRFTGQDNRLILDNLLRLSQMFPEKKIIARIPVIPGFNNTEEDLRKIIALIPNAPNIGVELLAYHRLGENKYAFLGRDYPYKGVKPDEAGFQKLKKTLLG